MLYYPHHDVKKIDNLSLFLKFKFCCSEKSSWNE